MTKETISSRAARIIGGRVFGPFNANGKPGDRESFRLDKAARVYLWNRNVRRMGARAALEAALPAAYDSGWPKQWYGPRGGAGAPFKAGSDSLRWIESTEAAGLRFVGWSDDIAPRAVCHTGWHCDDEGRETLRGGVWQLPAKDGRARLLYGYAEFEGRREMNEGSAAVCVSHVELAERDDGTALPGEAARDCAIWADGLAETAAEERRDYAESYQAGREAAELDNEAAEARAELLPLLAELRAERKAGGLERPAICAALRRNVDSLLETISAKRAARDSAWAACPSWAEDGWKAGFMDESAGGFARAVRLGFAKRSDWRGPAEACPC